MWLLKQKLLILKIKRKNRKKFNRIKNNENNLILVSRKKIIRRPKIFYKVILYLIIIYPLVLMNFRYNQKNLALKKNYLHNKDLWVMISRSMMKIRKIWKTKESTRMKKIYLKIIIRCMRNNKNYIKLVEDKRICR